MKTILVPTDFSKHSKVAALYALNLARYLEAEIVLMSVISVNTTSQTLLKWKKLEEEMISTAQNDAKEFIQELKEVDSTVNVKFSPMMGLPLEEMVDQFAVEHAVDLIVMGTKGASGLKKLLIGSNTTAVINRSSVPVVAVPSDTKSNPVKTIVYATDLTNLYEEIMPVVLFADAFDAAVHVLHVLPPESIDEVDSKIENEKLIKRAKYPKISFTEMRSNNVPEAVDKFVVEMKADMLTMFTHQLGFFDKMFGKSVTQQMAFHSHVPVLSFNKSTLL